MHVTTRTYVVIAGSHVITLNNAVQTVLNSESALYLESRPAK